MASKNSNYFTDQNKLTKVAIPEPNPAKSALSSTQAHSERSDIDNLPMPTLQ